MVDTLKVSTLSIILTGKKTNHKQHKLWLWTVIVANCK